MSDQDRIREHDCFTAMVAGLEQAAAGAEGMARLRPDQAYAWQKLAEAFNVNKMACWKLAEEAATKGIKQ